MEYVAVATKKHFLQSQKTSLLYNYHTQKKMISHEAKQYFYLVYLHKIKTIVCFTDYIKIVGV